MAIPIAFQDQDGHLHCTSMQLTAIVFVLSAPAAEQSAEQPAVACQRQKAKRTPRKQPSAPLPRRPGPPTPPPPPPSSQVLEEALDEVLEALCSCRYIGCTTVPMGSNLILRLSRIPSLSNFRVEGVRFGRLEHWARLIEETRAPNIVVYATPGKDFFSVTAKPRLNQRVDTRSAICWLRDAAGLGFCCDERGGVFRLEVSRSPADHDDPWGECLAYLIWAISVVFPVSTCDLN